MSANGRSASARSPIEIMELGASQGSVITVTAEGMDAKVAAQAVKAYFEKTL